MARAEKMIRIQTLFDILNKHNVPTNVNAQVEIQEKSLEAAPVIHAWWRVIETKIPVIACSNCWGECDVKYRLVYNFCPFCGARMDLKVRINK